MTESTASSFQFETLGIHTALKRSQDGVQDTAVYTSTSFVFNDSAHGAAIFNGTAEAFAYSRIGNPTLDVFEKRMVALEGGAAGLATASGQAAVFIAITALAQTGDNIVIASNVSESTRQQVTYRLPPLGITARFTTSGEMNDVRGAIDDNTKCVFVESIPTSDLVVSDIAAHANVAHEAGVPLVVDNTAGAGGFLIRPVDHGADIVLESAGEWLSISGSSSGGIIIDSGKFDWQKNKKRFPQFFEPSPGFHGLKLFEKFGKLAYAVFARAAIMRDIGPCLNPFEAFQLLAGVETLAVRLEKNSNNALELARFLEGNAKVEDVKYPGLTKISSSPPRLDYFKKENNCGGVLSFKIKVEAIGTSPESFVERFGIVSRSGSVGGSKTVFVEGERSEESQDQARPIIISVGLENIKDIIADFEHALSGL